MTPAEYVNEIVVPTVREARDDRRSRRKSYLASVVVFHVKDYLKKSGESGIENNMRTLTGKHFDVVRGVCNGTKHLVVDDSHKVKFKPGQDFDRPPAILGLMRLGVSRLGDAKGGREFRDGDSSFDIYASAKRVLDAFIEAYPAHLSGCDTSDC